MIRRQCINEHTHKNLHIHAVPLQNVPQYSWTAAWELKHCRCSVQRNILLSIPTFRLRLFTSFCTCRWKQQNNTLYTTICCIYICMFWELKCNWHDALRPRWVPVIIWYNICWLFKKIQPYGNNIMRQNLWREIRSCYSQLVGNILIY